MADKKRLVHFDQVNEMLEGDPAYIKEFCQAAIKSFELFDEEFKQHMKNRDLKNLRKSGHRIKPVAQMLDIESLITEYEKGKNILKNERSADEINSSITRVELLIQQILKEFHNKIS